MKKSIKIMTVAVLLASMLFTFAGCNPEKKGDATVTKMFEALKISDFETAKKYANFDAVELNMGEREEDKAEENAEESAYIISKILSTLQYEIVSSEKIDKNNVTVVAKVTNINTKPIVEKVLRELVALSFSQALSTRPIDEDEETQKLFECFKAELEKEDAETFTRTVTIKVSKVDKNWQVMVDNELFDAMFGGLPELINKVGRGSEITDWD